jgi:metal-responsive CopG/Arc/MetJ family transcriptional regulator
MKTRLSITVEQTLLNEVKEIAAKKKISISEIVEDHFKSLIKQKKKTLTEKLNE